MTSEVLIISFLVLLVVIVGDCAVTWFERFVSKRLNNQRRERK